MQSNTTYVYKRKRQLLRAFGWVTLRDDAWVSPTGARYAGTEAAFDMMALVELTKQTQQSKPRVAVTLPAFKAAHQAPTNNDEDDMQPVPYHVDFDLY